QPALADPGLADQEGHATSPRPDHLEQPPELFERSVAADHRADQPDALEAALSARFRPPRHDSVGVDRVGLALDLEAATILDLEGLAGEAQRVGGDEDG